jgi:hypothetical protein
MLLLGWNEAKCFQVESDQSREPSLGMNVRKCLHFLTWSASVWKLMGSTPTTAKLDPHFGSWKSWGVSSIWIKVLKLFFNHWKVLENYCNKMGLHSKQIFMT